VLVLALERSSYWWIAYVPACAALSLTHPIAVTVVAAHVVAVVLALRETRAPIAAAAAALALGAAAAAPLALATAADRADADGAGAFDLGEIATGLGRAGGWNVALLVLAALGLFALVSGRMPGAPPWQAALVVGLIAAPLAGVVLAGAFVPVFPARALVVCAPGLAVACGAGVAWIPDRRLKLGAAGALAVLALPALVGWYAGAAPENWRSAVATVENGVGASETVVVVPPRSRAAVAYYAPSLRVSTQARGAGAWVFDRNADDRGAIRAARRVVRTPRFALLAQERYGERLALQHWVRP
jgi:mannosyltransferase